MFTHATARTEPRGGARASDLSKVYTQGIIAGALGGSAIAIWFLLLDGISGRPFYTPSVLGTMLFRGLDGPPPYPVSFEMVIVFTWVHFLAFGVIGGVASRLLAFAETAPNAAFGIIMLFVFLEVGVIVALDLLSEAAFEVLSWQAVFAGNLIAAGVMSLYFWRCHPNLEIRP